MVQGAVLEGLAGVDHLLEGSVQFSNALRDIFNFIFNIFYLIFWFLGLEHEGVWLDCKGFFGVESDNLELDDEVSLGLEDLELVLLLSELIVQIIVLEELLFFNLVDGLDISQEGGSNFFLHVGRLWHHLVGLVGVDRLALSLLQVVISLDDLRLHVSI